MNDVLDADLAARLQRLGGRALRVGVVGLALSLLGALFDRRQFFRSYLTGFLLWVGVPLGSLALLMLHHLAGGGWGFVIRRVTEAAGRTLPLLFLFFLPVALGAGSIYEWTHVDAVAGDPVLQGKSAYLNLPFFLARAGAYFAIWIALAHFLSAWSRAQDRGQRALANRLQSLSGVGLLLYGLTGTFAAVDWAMSLEPHWFSAGYGLLFVVAQVLSGLAFSIVALRLLARHPPLDGAASAVRYHDLGNLLLAFVMLWAYLAFSQYLIIWSANLPEETPFYLNRSRGGWEVFGPLLVLFHFAVPFLLLLQRPLKRKAERLVWVAGALLVMRFVDLTWLVAPAFSPGRLGLSPLDLAAPAGIGGVFVWFFARQLRAAPLLPQGDPRFAELLGHGAAEHPAP